MQKHNARVTPLIEHVHSTDRAFALGGDDVVTGYGDGQGYTPYMTVTGDGVPIEVAFNETLQGDGGNDHIYSEHASDYLQFTTDVAIDKGNSDTGSGNFGDILLGNAGEDTLFGGLNNDALLGGTGNDLIIAGAGDDQIYGDRETIGDRPLIFFNWQRCSKSLKSFQLLILSVQYPGCRDWCATANTMMPLAWGR